MNVIFVVITVGVNPGVIIGKTIEQIELQCEMDLNHMSKNQELYEIQKRTLDSCGLWCIDSFLINGEWIPYNLAVSMRYKDYQHS